MEKEKLIQVKNLKTYFYTDAGTAKAVDDISFHMSSGNIDAGDICLYGIN